MRLAVLLSITLAFSAAARTHKPLLSRDDANCTTIAIDRNTHDHEPGEIFLDAAGHWFYDDWDTVQQLAMAPGAGRKGDYSVCIANQIMAHPASASPTGGSVKPNFECNNPYRMSGAWKSDPLWVACQGLK